MTNNDLLKIVVYSGQRSLNFSKSFSLSNEDFIKLTGEESNNLDLSNVKPYDSIKEVPYLNEKPWNEKHPCAGSGGIFVPIKGKEYSGYAINAYPQRHVEDYLGIKHWSIPININQVFPSGNSRKIKAQIPFDIRHIPWKVVNIKIYKCGESKPFVDKPLFPK